MVERKMSKTWEEGLFKERTLRLRLLSTIFSGNAFTIGLFSGE